MRDAIKRKIDEVYELFPKHRVETSKTRIRAQWNRSLTADRYPVTYNPVLFEYYNDVHTPSYRHAII